MLRNVLQCVKEPSERFLLTLSVGARHPEQILTDVADRTVWVYMLGLWNLQCRRGGWVAGNVAYVCTFSVLSVCVSIVQINPSHQAQVTVQLKGQSFQFTVKIFSRSAPCPPNPLLEPLEIFKFTTSTTGDFPG